MPLLVNSSELVKPNVPLQVNSSKLVIRTSVPVLKNSSELVGKPCQWSEKQINLPVMIKNQPKDVTF